MRAPSHSGLIEARRFDLARDARRAARVRLRVISRARLSPPPRDDPPPPPRGPHASFCDVARNFCRGKKTLDDKMKPRVISSCISLYTYVIAQRWCGYVSRDNEKGVRRLGRETMTPRATVFLALFLIASLRRRAALGRRLLTGIHLTLRLARFSTIRWVFKLLGLVAYALVLSPAFLRVAWSYFTSRKIIRRSIVYGKQPRNTLDVFLPDDADFISQLEQSGALDQRGRWEPKHSGTEAIKDEEKVVRRPVVIFVTGGMWIIGYKAWGALLAQRLARR